LLRGTLRDLLGERNDSSFSEEVVRDRDLFRRARPATKLVPRDGADLDFCFALDERLEPAALGPAPR
jgi:hypothetical protein